MKNKFKSIIVLSFFTIMSAVAQSGDVGIGTTNPHVSAVLDVTSTDKGFLPPRMTNSQMTAIANPAEGLILYCLDCVPKGLYIYDGTDWVSTVPTDVVVADCSNNGFTGDFANNVALSGATFSVTINNNNLFNEANLSFAINDLVLSGVSGITVVSVSPATASITGGSTQLVTYNLSGTPTAIGTLTGTWTKATLSCSNTKTVVESPTITLTSAVGTDAQELLPNTAITDITYSIEGEGVTNATVSGLPIGVSYSYNSGTLTISGTPTTYGGNTYTITTVGGSPNVTKTGSISRVIVDKMFDLADNNGNTDSHKFIYLPISTPDGKIWLNNNLGAHYANMNHASFNPTQQATSETDYLAYGSLFQWGRKPDGHELINRTSSTVSTAVNGVTTTLSSSDDAVDALFINPSSTPFDWRVTQIDSAWDTEDSAYNPCPKGYRVPTTAEFISLFTALNITNGPTAASSSLKFTYAGTRGSTITSGSIGYYWTSTVNGELSRNRTIYSSGVTGVNGSRASGLSVRCIKD